LLRVSAGNKFTSSDASLMAGSCVKPRNEVCATRSSWALMAALIFGWAWPWMFVQIEELLSDRHRLWSRQFDDTAVDVVFTRSGLWIVLDWGAP